MTPQFELPRLRVLARHAVPRFVEGTVIPVSLFMVMIRLTGVWGAMFVGLAYSYIAAVRRLVRGRQVPGIILLGTVTVTARCALALGTGSAFVYFLQPMFGAIIVASAFVVSVVMGRPLAQRLAVDFCPIPASFLQDDRVRQFFSRISLLWSLVFVTNASVTFWLLLTQPTATFVLAKTAVSAFLTMAALATSTGLFRRSMTRHGLLAPRSGRGAAVAVAA